MTSKSSLLISCLGLRLYMEEISSPSKLTLNGNGTNTCQGTFLFQSCLSNWSVISTSRILLNYVEVLKSLKFPPNVVVEF